LNNSTPSLLCKSYRLPLRQAGFTLIEIMVVVVIIAVMSVAVSLSLGGTSDRTARLQANRFIAVVNEVRDEAIISGQDYALIVEENAQTYSFSAVSGNAPAPVIDALFKIRSIDPSVEVQWKVFDVFEDDKEATPKALISSLGEITPFEMSFGGKKASFTVFLNDEGQLERRDRQARL
jgi:general secretion pathway protein H